MQNSDWLKEFRDYHRLHYKMEIFQKGLPVSRGLITDIFY